MGGVWLVLAERGEEAVATLQRAAGEAGLCAAQVSAIGAVEWAKIGLYHLDRREYTRVRLEGPLEVASLQGNLSIYQGKPFLHAHTVLSDVRMQAFGGHLFEAEVGASLEAVLRPLDGDLLRADDPATGLKLWCMG